MFRDRAEGLRSKEPRGGDTGRHRETQRDRERQKDRSAKQAHSALSVSDVTKLAYGGYPSPVDVWKEQQDTLNQWAEAVPAVLPRTSPMETWGLSPALTAQLRAQTQTQTQTQTRGKDEPASAQAVVPPSTAGGQQKKEIKQPQCSRTTLQQLSQPKRTHPVPIVILCYPRSQLEFPPDRETEKQRDRETRGTEGQRDRETERQRDRETVRF